MSLTVRQLGVCDYAATLARMQAFTAARDAASQDELWLLEHPPVYTLGLAGRPEHVLAPGAIPVLRSDRGGQVTYHGPGQLVAYLLLDLKRAGIGVRGLVHLLEAAVIDLLAEHALHGSRRPGAPGVYVDGAKIAQLGLRVRGGCSYHGLALNVDLDPAPFAGINPCGYPALPVTSLRELGVGLDVARAGARLAALLCARLASGGAAPHAAGEHRPLLEQDA